MPRRSSPHAFSTAAQSAPVAVPPILVDEPTAAAMLGVCARTVFDLVKTGSLPARMIPGAETRKLFHVDDLRAYAAGLPAYKSLNRQDPRKEPRP